MKPISFIGLILMMTFIVSCDLRPKTSCGCLRSSINKMDKIDKKDSLIRLFDPKRKAHYQNDLNNLFAYAKRIDDHVRYCREIYDKKGFCKEGVPSGFSFWDYGDLVSPVNEENYRNQYSGIWKKDSLRYCRRRRVGPVTMESIKERVFLRLWFKAEDDNLPLTEREQKFYDSMSVSRHVNYIRFNDDSTLFQGRYSDSTTIFPRMWDDSLSIEEMELRSYLQREKYGK